MSVVELYGESRSRCGYCKLSGTQRERTSVSFGMSAKTLTCEDYQALVDRGWRRSGTYLYKPINETTCCPCYTIRLEAACFQPDKAQRGVMRRIERLTASGPSEGNEECAPKARQSLKRKRGGAGEGPVTTLMTVLEKALSEAARHVMTIEGLPDFNISDAVRVQNVKGQVANAKSGNRGDLCTACALQLTAALRRASRGTSSGQETKSPLTPSSVAERLIGSLPSLPEVDSVTVAGNGFINFHLTPQAKAIALSQGGIATIEEVVEGGGKGQAEVRQDQTPMACQELGEDEMMGADMEESGSRVPGPEAGWGHTFRVETVLPVATDEVFDLYKRYQLAVHDDKPDEVTREGFVRFLVQSPLTRTTQAMESEYAVPYGSYHQHYRLDGKLIAVGVVDVLPKCLSSVYCFYDPDYRYLVLGKLTALWEIKWVQEASRLRADLRYYYLGYYIHTCPKMKYKGGEHREGHDLVSSDEAVRLAEALHIDIGPLVLLPPRAQRLLRPVLAQLCTLIGPDVSQRIRINLR